MFILSSLFPLGADLLTSAIVDSTTNNEMYAFKAKTPVIISRGRDS